MRDIFIFLLLFIFGVRSEKIHFLKEKGIAYVELADAHLGFIVSEHTQTIKLLLDFPQITDSPHTESAHCTALNKEFQFNKVNINNYALDYFRRRTQHFLSRKTKVPKIPSLQEFKARTSLRRSTSDSDSAPEIVVLSDDLPDQAATAAPEQTPLEQNTTLELQGYVLRNFTSSSDKPRYDLLRGDKDGFTFDCTEESEFIGFSLNKILLSFSFSVKGPKSHTDINFSAKVTTKSNVANCTVAEVTQNLDGNFDYLFACDHYDQEYSHTILTAEFSDTSVCNVTSLNNLKIHAQPSDKVTTSTIENVRSTVTSNITQETSAMVTTTTTATTTTVTTKRTIAPTPKPLRRNFGRNSRRKNSRSLRRRKRQFGEIIGLVGLGSAIGYGVNELTHQDTSSHEVEKVVNHDELALNHVIMNMNKADLAIKILSNETNQMIHHITDNLCSLGKEETDISVNVFLSELFTDFINYIHIIFASTGQNMPGNKLHMLSARVCSLFNPDVPKTFCDNFYDTVGTYKIIGIDLTAKTANHQGVFIQIAIKTPQLTNFAASIYSISQVPIPLGMNESLYKFALYEHTPKLFANLTNESRLIPLDACLRTENYFFCKWSTYNNFYEKSDMCLNLLFVKGTTHCLTSYLSSKLNCFFSQIGELGLLLSAVGPYQVEERMETHISRNHFTNFMDLGSQNLTTTIITPKSNSLIRCKNNIFSYKKGTYSTIELEEVELPSKIPFLPYPEPPVQLDLDEKILTKIEHSDLPTNMSTIHPYIPSFTSDHPWYYKLAIYGALGCLALIIILFFIAIIKYSIMLCVEKCFFRKSFSSQEPITDRINESVF